MKKKFLITLSLISILSAILTVYAWTNPGQNPPLGGGVLQTDTSGLKIITTTRITSGNLIVNTGNVGIGTTAPNTKLHVANGDVRIGEINPLNTGTFPGYGRYLYFSGGPAGSTWDSDNSDALWIARYNVASDQTELRVNIGDNQQAEDAFVIGTSASGGIWNLFRVQSNGNVGIGTTAPSQKLHVAGGSAVVGYIPGSSGGVFIAQPAAYGQPAIQGVTSTFAPGTLAINPVGGNVGIGTTAPSWGKLQIEDTAVPLAFRETDQTGAGSLWRMPLDSKILRFDVSQNGTDFTSYVVPLAMTPSGNVGIGTTAPRGKLDLTGTGDIWVKTVRFVSNDVGWGEDNSDPYLLEKVHDSPNVSHLDLQLNDDANEEFRIYGYSCNGYGCGVRSGNLYHFFRSDGTAYHAGNVGIGTTAPAYRLDVAGNIRTTGCVVYNGGTLGTCVSDIRLKDNITDLSFNNALTKVLSLKPKQFTLKNDPSQKISGLIAQDVEQIAPELVVTDEKGYKQIKYGDIQWLLIEAIKEQQKEIEELKAKVLKMTND